MPLKAICSRKWAVPFDVSVSAREPASIHTPTVAVWAWGCASVATVSPFERVVTSVNGLCETAVASDRESTCHGPPGAEIFVIEQEIEFSKRLTHGSPHGATQRTRECCGKCS